MNCLAKAILASLFVALIVVSKNSEAQSVSLTCSINNGTSGSTACGAPHAAGTYSVRSIVTLPPGNFQIYWGISGCTIYDTICVFSTPAHNNDQEITIDPWVYNVDTYQTVFPVVTAYIPATCWFSGWVFC